MIVHYEPLRALGFEPHFEQAFADGALEGERPARVVAEHKGGYELLSADGVGMAQLAGKLRRAVKQGEAVRPAVGDWVGFTGKPADAWLTIVRTLPRKTSLVRKAAGRETVPQVVAANVDVVFLSVPLDRPPNLRWLERYLAAIYESGARPVLLLTKSDLGDAEAVRAQLLEQAPALPVLAVSAKTGEGLDDVRAAFAAAGTGAIIGASGVGKSTVINALLGRELLAVAELDSLGKGRHTTTRRELIRLPGGGLIIDTPGMRELGLWEADEALLAAFDDIEDLAQRCRFSDCRHEREPGCAVRGAVTAGALPEDRVEAWLKLRREAERHASQRDVHARLEEKRRHKALSRAIKDFPNKKR